MDQRNGRLAFSPSDLNAFLTYEHLTALGLAVARGALERPEVDNPQGDLIRRPGEEHEAAFLQAPREEGTSVAEIELDEGQWDLERAAVETGDVRGRRRRLPGDVPRSRRLARIRRLPRARRDARPKWSVQLRGRRHEARVAPYEGRRDF